MNSRTATSRNNDTTQTAGARRAAWLRSACWGLLLAGHAPALLRALQDEPFSLRSAILLLCEALFTLKIADVRWLRLPASRRTWFVAAACVALLHADVLRNTAPADVASVNWTISESVLAGGVLAGLVALRMRRDPSGFIRWGRLWTLLRANLSLLRAWLEARLLPPRMIERLAVPSLDRAPPR